MRYLKVLCAALMLAWPTMMHVAPAQAVDSGYVSTVVQALAQDPLYVDPLAVPPMKAANQDKVKALIASTGKPFYVVLMDDAQRGNTEYDALPKVFHDAMAGDSKALIIVASNGQIRAQGFGLPDVVMQKVQSITTDAVANASGLTSAITAIITRLDAIRTDGGAASNTNSNSGVGVSSSGTSSNSSSGGDAGVIVLVVLLALIGLAGAGYLVVVLVRRGTNRKQASARQATIKSNLKARLEALDNKVLLGGNPDDTKAVTDALALAALEVKAGQSCLDTGDLDGAGIHIANAEDHFDDAERLRDGRPPRADEERVQPFTREARDADVVYAQHPDLGSVRVRHDEYRPSRRATADYSNYYGGGYWGGQLYPSGYYRDPFWTWDVLGHDHSGTHHRRDDYVPSQPAAEPERHHESTSWDSGSSGARSGVGGGHVSRDTYEDSPPSHYDSGTSWGSSDSSSSSDTSWSSSDSGSSDSGVGGGSVSGDN